MKLIDKSALVAEIDKLRKNQRLDDRHGQGVLDGLHAMERFLNILEVKEVDFDAEWKRYFEHRGEMATVNVKHLAKHFFELGMLSTITEEDCKLIWNISDELPCMREEDFFKEMLRRYKVQKGEET